VRSLGCAALSALALGFSAPADAWDLNALMQRMAQVPASEGTFTESKHIALLTAPVHSQGRLSYVRPDRILKHTLSPFDELISLDGDWVSIDNKSKGQRRRVELQHSPVVWGLVEGLRATLAGDLAQIRRHFRVEFSGTRDAWAMSLEPLDSRIAGHLKAISIAGSDIRFTRVEILEASGDRSIMTIQIDDR